MLRVKPPEHLQCELIKDLNIFLNNGSCAAVFTVDNVEWLSASKCVLGKPVNHRKNNYQ